MMVVSCESEGPCSAPQLPLLSAVVPTSAFPPKQGTRMVDLELDMSKEVSESMAIHSCYQTLHSHEDSLPPIH
jgi:hypothetical protein